MSQKSSPQTRFPVELVELARRFADVQTFVETGTWNGKTAIWASENFKHVYTTELYRPRYESFLETYSSKYGNVEILLGESPHVLAEIKPNLRGLSGVMYWLDAHWCGNGSACGSFGECPLLAELEAIGELCPGDVIVIDDARLMVEPPPSPHKASDWPNLEQIQQTLNKWPSRSTFKRYKDTLVVAPPEFLSEIQDV